MAGIDGLVEKHMLRPFEWGEADCCMSVCNVLRDLGFADPAERYRGVYDSAMHDLGTVEDTAVREFSRLGWPEVWEFMDGDVGVYGNSLFIRHAGAWVGKSQDGIVIKNKVRRAWRPQ